VDDEQDDGELADEVEEGSEGSAESEDEEDEEDEEVSAAENELLARTKMVLVKADSGKPCIYASK
jgi:hypothetical protein